MALKGGNFKKAKMHYQHLLVANENDLALVGIGECELGESQFLPAFNAFTKATLFNPENHRAWYGRAVASLNRVLT